MRFLAQSQPQTVFLAALFDRLFDIVGQAVEPIRRTSTIDPLVRTLMVVVMHPVVQALARVGKRSEHRFTEILSPQSLPETFDLAQGHRVLRC